MEGFFPQPVKVLSLLDERGFDVAALATVVAQDPVLSGTLLKHANSPLCRRNREITNVRDAISLLGIKKVQLAIRVASMRALPKLDSPLVDTLWEHSYAIALLARLIAQRTTGSPPPDDLELTGLLHDFLALVLMTNFPKQLDALYREAVLSGVPISDLERKELGKNYGAIIDWMEESLRLPYATIGALRLVHGGGAQLDPAQPGFVQFLILSLAHHVETSLNVKEDHLVQRPWLPLDAVLEQLALTDEDTRATVDEYYQVLDS